MNQQQQWQQALQDDTPRLDSSAIDRHLDTQGCPECNGIGEVQRFVMYVGVITNACARCRGWGTLP